jgi:hypothetical protein
VEGIVFSLNVFEGFDFSFLSHEQEQPVRETQPGVWGKKDRGGNGWFPPRPVVILSAGF